MKSITSLFSSDSVKNIVERSSAVLDVFSKTVRDLTELNEVIDSEASKKLEEKN